MRILATGNNDRQSRDKRCHGKGFTIIEVLVALVIVGLISAAVVTSLGAVQKVAHADAQRFMARALLAAQESILAGKPIGMAVDNQGYRFYRFQTGQWQDADEPNLNPSVWNRTLTVELDLQSLAKREEQETKTQPDVVFDPTGLVTPFKLKLYGGEDGYVIQADVRGAMTMVPYDAQR